MTPLKVLAISGSLRAHSANTELLRAAARLEPSAITVRLYDGMGNLPHFNPDDDREDSIVHAAVAQLRGHVAAADALLISSPEYAHGVPGALKNALDWLVSSPAMVGKPVGVLTASSLAIHAPVSLVETLRTMSALVVEEAVRVVPLAGRRLDASGILREPILVGAVREALQALGRAVASGGVGRSLVSARVTVELLKAFLDAFNRHDLDAIMEFFAEDCVFYMPRGVGPRGDRYVGRAEVRAGLAKRFDGIPDVHYGEDAHWVCGHCGVSEWTLTGTPVSGAPIRVRGVDLLEFSNGKITRKDSFWKIVQ